MARQGHSRPGHQWQFVMTSIYYLQDQRQNGSERQFIGNMTTVPSYPVPEVWSGPRGTKCWVGLDESCYIFVFQGTASDRENMSLQNLEHECQNWPLFFLDISEFDDAGVIYSSYTN